MGFVSSVSFWRTCERMDFVSFWRTCERADFVSFCTCERMGFVSSVFGVPVNLCGFRQIFPSGVPVNCERMERMGFSSVFGVPVNLWNSYGIRFWRTCERADFVSF